VGSGFRLDRGCDQSTEEGRRDGEGKSEDNVYFGFEFNGQSGHARQIHILTPGFKERTGKTISQAGRPAAISRPSTSFDFPGNITEISTSSADGVV